jgi:hypothetical protein
MSKKFKIEIASPFDRENLVAEIWHNDDLVCELNTENKVPQIIFYIEKESLFDYYEFIEIIKKAKEKLLNEI